MILITIRIYIWKDNVWICDSNLRCLADEHEQKGDTCADVVWCVWRVMKTQRDGASRTSKNSEENETNSRQHIAVYGLHVIHSLFISLSLTLSPWKDASVYVRLTEISYVIAMKSQLSATVYGSLKIKYIFRKTLRTNPKTIT